MPTLRLPSAPSLVHLRKLARELQHRLRSDDPEAKALLLEHYPPSDSRPGGQQEYPLHLAQLVLARQYGFPSWPRLVAHVEVLEKFSRTPDVDPPDLDPVGQFLVNAVLRYGDQDGPTRWSTARRMLSEHPSLGRSNIHTACVIADHVAVGQFLLRDPALANGQGGPLGWEPLLYLAYSRLDPQVARTDVLATARLLLDAGADPNAGFLWHGETTAFTVLTGILGSGEQGISNQPHHPHALALARLLLQAGADANDGQALYNRMFEPENDHLQLLFEFGLGEGDGGPWHRRLPETSESPTVMVRGQLRWAISHAMVERIRLLAAHGVDLASPLRTRGTSATPVEWALKSGLPQIARLLMDLGAPERGLDAGFAMVAALLTGDRKQVAKLSTPDLLARIKKQNPALILRAAVAGSREGIDLLVANGFDVNALGRQDLPIEQEWETALHHAADAGDLELARVLLAAGANPNLRDRRFDATPLGWAEHAGQQEMVDLLRPLTADTAERA